jgi:solute:Na+ symporter, SSS family
VAGVSWIDWSVLILALAYFVIYGTWKGRKQKSLEGYILASREKRWYTVALSIMATQASAITFLSTPGQAYADGMRFVQFYFGLPLAMVVLSITAVPIFHRLKVFTAYEFLEQRFDLKTRWLAAFLFLVQRGLACGLTIYAPAVILSILLGWNLHVTIITLGVLVVIYTASGGTKAVDHTNFQQMLIIMFGMVAAFVVILSLLPGDVSIFEAVKIAGKSGRMNVVELKFDPNDRYNIWTGILGGFFLALSYFGTDQSQVGRYLGGQSIAQSRIALLFNGLAKIPMQFFILFVGIMVFVFYQFHTPPIFFNNVTLNKIHDRDETSGDYLRLRAQHEKLSAEKKVVIGSMLEGMRAGDDAAVDRQTAILAGKNSALKKVKTEFTTLVKKVDPKNETNDTNYVFLTFVINHLPVGLIGIVLAATFAASMSSTSSELNALASTTVVDFYKRSINTNGSEMHYVRFSKLATLFWGAFGIIFAETANRLGSLIEAVNYLGSLFYGTILGIFLLAFYFKRVRGNAAFTAGVIGEIVVIAVSQLTEVAFLWYNVIGCVVVIVVALIVSLFDKPEATPAPA